jgi:cobalt/nickel transport system permease protein
MKRVLLLNVFLGFIVLTLPFGVAGSPLFTADWLYGATYSREGLERAGYIAWRVNVVFALCWSLIATMQPIRLGTALLDLKISPKLAHLVFFSFRYVDELKSDFVSIRRAMVARGFSFSVRSLRGIGYLLGNLMTRSLDKSERMLRAMKGRGFVDGFPRFSVVQPVRVSDWLFAIAMLLPIAMVVVQGRCG